MGRHTSPERVIRALEAVIDRIQRGGLFIGRDEDEFFWEPLKSVVANVGRRRTRESMQLGPPRLPRERALVGS